MKRHQYQMLGRKIKVEYIPAKQADDIGIDGDFNSSTMTIRIKDSLTQKEHEAEESLVRGLEHALTDVVKLK